MSATRQPQSMLVLKWDPTCRDNSGNISVPYGGEFELLQYNNKFLPEEAIIAPGLKKQKKKFLVFHASLLLTVYTPGCGRPFWCWPAFIFGHACFPS